MRRTIVILVLVGVTAAAALWGYGEWQAREAEQAAAEQAVDEVDDLADVIWASGNLRPVQWAGLSPALGGVVIAIHVAEGDWVEAGTLLIELENAMLRAQVDSATAGIAEAEAALARLRAGATAGEVALAESRVAAAQAQVSLAAGQMLEIEAAITQAEAHVQIARDQYAEIASRPTTAELNAAAAEVAIAEAAVAHAQAAYNLVRGDPNIGSRPEALALFQATATLEAAQAKALVVQQGPTAEQLAVVRGQISAAEAALEMARSRAVGAQAAVQAALADQAGAQATLDELRGGATVEEIAIAEARVLSARAALHVSEATLRQVEVRAPFAGQVGSIQVRQGEMATPGMSLLLLGDAHAMHVETTDLRETDVLRLRQGMPAEVTFDALPDRIFQGTITKIAPVSSTERGSTNFTITIDVTDLDPDLRWGMTAFVNINAPR